MSKGQFNVQKFYRLTIDSLERQFKENVSQKEIWSIFSNELSKRFRKIVTFDSVFADSLRDYFKNIQETFSGTEDYLAKISWVELLNNLAYQQKFMSYRDYIKIHNEIEDIKNSPSIQWLNNLSYLKSKDLTEFREEFLNRFVQMPEDQLETLMEQLQNKEIDALERLKSQYEKFFSKFFDGKIDLKVASYLESIWSSMENKAEMLSPKLTASLERLLGKDVGKNKEQVVINNNLIKIAQDNLYQNDQNVQQRLQNEVELIKKALEKFSGLNVIKEKNIELHLGQFGSLTSGFAGLDADLDLTIITNSYVKEDEFLKILYEFLKKEYQEGDRRSTGRKAIPELILTAKTPLITIKISERGKSQIKVDIIINNILGVINSKFLRVYAGVKWVKNLGILVKMWGKAVRLIDKSALSSYAMILMLIHYLIKMKLVKPILDARSRSKDSPHFTFKRLKLNDKDEFDVYYTFKSKPEDVSTIERVNYLKILKGFMLYYAHDIWDEKEKKIITVDQTYNKQIDRQTVITIKDPFDQPHNPGRLKADSKDFMISRFRDAYEILSQGKPERINQLFYN